MQKKHRKICIYQKKAVLLHPLLRNSRFLRLRNRKMYRGVEQW